jgi:N utilization substance protein B
MAKVNTTDPRRKARMAALQSLFAADVTSNRGGVSLDWLASEDALGSTAVGFAEVLVRGVTDSRPELDTIIRRYAPAWPVDQLPFVDRNILRIALFELLHTPKVPRKTAINEAVELAKVFGSESSTRFVNGVLGSVMAGLDTGEISAEETAAEGR